MSARELTADEIAVLERQGCRAEDWSLVTVAENFSPAGTVRDSVFIGRVELGAFEKRVDAGGGLFLPSGLDHARLADVKVGADCLVNHVQASAVDIGDGAVVQWVASISGGGGKTFANGLPAHALAEDGGRSVPIWRELTAQTAHLACHLRNHPAGDALAAMAAADAATLRGCRSRIGAGSRVARCGALRDVWIGPAAEVTGVVSLRDCYVDSLPEAPSRVGEGVSAEECVFLPACRVEGGVRLHRCLVGEGVRLEHGFFASHSLFFANSDFGLGEASCVMAGPFAVSHHRATLALACQCSFNNFGSASNSSNHHFKQGPRHGGVLRRGARCGSGSYIFWPSDIGAFTTVVGRHAAHLDTVDFPFSLLAAKGEASVLVPGVNLFASGMFRDAVKWAERDRRGGLSRPRDLVNPAILSPYTMQAVDKGVLLLRRSEGTEADLRHGGAVIPAGRIKPALRLYEAAMVYYVGRCLLERVLEETEGAPPGRGHFVEVVSRALEGGYGASGGRWRDWGGMLLPGNRAEALIDDLATGRIAEPDALRRELEREHERYRDNETDWAARRWRREHGDPSPDGVASFVDKWREAVSFRHELLVRDVGKEFTQEMMHGFGVEEDAAVEFRRVRGDASEQPMLRSSREERDRLLDIVKDV